MMVFWGLGDDFGPAGLWPNRGGQRNLAKKTMAKSCSHRYRLPTLKPIRWANDEAFSSRILKADNSRSFSSCVYLFAIF